MAETSDEYLSADQLEVRRLRAELAELREAASRFLGTITPIPDSASAYAPKLEIDALRAALARTKGEE